MKRVASFRKEKTSDRVGESDKRAGKSARREEQAMATMDIREVEVPATAVAMIDPGEAPLSRPWTTHVTSQPELPLTPVRRGILRRQDVEQEEWCEVRPSDVPDLLKGNHLSEGEYKKKATVVSLYISAKDRDNDFRKKLKKFLGVKRLHLEATIPFETIFAEHPALRHLESLSLSDFGKDVIIDTKFIAENCQNLKELTIRNVNGLGTEGLKKILENCKGLQTLRLENCNLSDADLEAVRTGVGRDGSKEIKHFFFKNNPLITDLGVSKLILAFTNAESLDFSDCPQLTSVLSIVTGTKRDSLTYLGSSTDKIDDLSLIEGMSRNLPSIKYLSITVASNSRNRVGNLRLRKIIDQYGKQLETLCLKGSDITSDAIKTHIGSVNSMGVQKENKCPNLATLDISDCEDVHNKDGIEALTNVLRTCTALKKVVIKGSGIESQTEVPDDFMKALRSFEGGRNGQFIMTPNCSLAEGINVEKAKMLPPTHVSRFCNLESQKTKLSF